MDIALCYENVIPARGGCETYIADLSRRLVADGHTVHLYACHWDDAALPREMRYHQLSVPRGPRFLRPWRFGAACEAALKKSQHDVSVGFDKTWGQDVLYPQGGLHAASTEHNFRKHPNNLMRGLARLTKKFDLAHWSFSSLERRQYTGPVKPLVIVNSDMVKRHFEQYYGIGEAEVRVVHSAIDPKRFREHDRPKRRMEWREHWGFAPGETVALMVAMNYRLKGLEPLLHAVKQIPADAPFKLLVAGNSRTAKYERLARRLRTTERVRFAGHCPDIRDAYFAADFLVHPTFYDPCSLVALEALACGLPVITTRWNGASELLGPAPSSYTLFRGEGEGMVKDEGYVLDDPHDHQQLAWCMTQLLDLNRRSACSQAARQAAARWTFDHHYQEIVEVFTEAATRKQAA